MNGSHSRDEERLQIRRIRSTEHSLIQDLCSLDSPSKSFYPDHDGWLERAIPELQKGLRVAFGAFELKFKGGSPISILNACVFLKHSDFDKSVELKNLTIRTEDYEGKSTSHESYLARHLIEKAIRFCEVREIPKVEIELPHHDHRTISIFLELGFRFSALKREIF